MDFRGQPFVFDSPSAAVAGLIAHLNGRGELRSTESVDLADVSGRILAADVHADRDSPAFDYSAMDGYAVRAAHVHAAAASGSVTIPVEVESRIGKPPPVFRQGNSTPFAARIATGAPVPVEVDSVIRREDVAEHRATTSGGVEAITVSADVAARVAPGDHIRRRAENARAGTCILRAGQVLSAAAVGSLAAAGVVSPRVYSRLRVAVIATGDELVDPSKPPELYQIRDSNGPAVRAALASQAWVEVRSVTRADDEEEVCGALRLACKDSDAVIITGGVSVGHRDPVRSAVERAGAKIVFHGLPQRPGKPMLGAVIGPGAGSAVQAMPVFGLPGNPVSALVTCTRIVLPVLAACAGASRTPPCCLPQQLELVNADGRTLDLWWHRLARHVVDAAGAPTLELIDARGSGDVVAVGKCDGFVEIPPRSTHRSVSFYAWPGNR
ncbi:MAG: molybdopterin molybdotransferase MoeA [Phycisphaerales bacterium]